MIENRFIYAELRIIPKRGANTNPMQFSANDQAPLTGEYMVFNAAGECIGSVIAESGGILPPMPDGLCYYEKRNAVISLNDERT